MVFLLFALVIYIPVWMVQLVICCFKKISCVSTYGIPSVSGTGAGSLVVGFLFFIILGPIFSSCCKCCNTKNRVRCFGKIFGECFGRRNR